MATEQTDTKWLHLRSIMPSVPCASVTRPSSTFTIWYIRHSPCIQSTFSLQSLQLFALAHFAQGLIVSSRGFLDSLVAELPELRAKGLTPELFAKSLAQLAVQKFSEPTLIAFWGIPAANQAQLLFYAESKHNYPWSEHLTSQEHSAFLRNAIQGNRQVGPESLAWKSTVLLANTTPVLFDNHIWGFLEILVLKNAQSTNTPLYEGLLAVLRCEMENAKTVHELQLEKTVVGNAESSQLIATRLLRCSEFSNLTFQLAHDAREFLGCDRASVLSIVQPKVRLEATSGVDTIDRKAASVTAMQALIETVAATGENLRYPLPDGNQPPQIIEACEKYVDVSQAKSFEVHLLKPPSTDPPSTPLSKPLPNLLGALLVESFHAPDFCSDNDKIQRLIPLGSSAFTSAWRNAAKIHSWLPTGWTRMTQGLPPGWGRHSRNHAKTWALAIGLLLAAGAIPLPVTVRCEGQLQPILRRDLYAPVDGDVVSVDFQHDDWVEPNQKLLVLSSRALELEQQKIEGELQTTEKRLLAVLSERLGNNSDSESNIRSTGQIAAEEQELQELRTSLRKQLEIIRKQQRDLSLTAPIRGRILTWDPQHLLLNRPVQRGQLLTTIADTQGDWTLELKVQGRNVSKLIAKAPDPNNTLDVRYTLATLPKESYRAKLTELAARVDWDPEYKESLLALAPTLNLPETNARPGAKVIASIHCGWYPIGLTWLSDIYNSLKTWLWL